MLLSGNTKAVQGIYNASVQRLPQGQLPSSSRFQLGFKGNGSFSSDGLVPDTSDEALDAFLGLLLLLGIPDVSSKFDCGDLNSSFGVNILFSLIPSVAVRS